MNKRDYLTRTLHIIAGVLFVGLTAVFPLYITDVAYAYITRQKMIFFCVFTAIAVAAILAATFFLSSWARIKQYFAEGKPWRKVPVFGWALLAFALLTLVSAAFSPWQEVVWMGFTRDGFAGRWEGFWVLLCYNVVFFIIWRFYRIKRAHLLIFAGSAVLVALYGIFQFAGWDLLRATGFFSPDFIPEIADGVTTSFRTTLGNINIVSAYCALSSILFAALFAAWDSKWGLLHLAASVLSFAMLMISAGDAGKLGVLGAVVLFIPYWLSKRERFAKMLLALSGWSLAYICYHGGLSLMKRGAESAPLVSPNDQRYLENYVSPGLLPYIVIAVALAAAGLCLIFVIKKWPGKTMKIVSTAFLAAALAGGLLFIEVMGRRLADQPENIMWQAREILHGRLDDSFGSNRGWVWKRSLAVIPDNPLIGTGPDTFLFALGVEGQREAVERYGVTFDKPHNSFLQIAVCLGLPALGAYLVFLGGLFSKTLKKAFDQPILLAFCAAAVSFLIQSFFEIDTPIDRPLLWAVLGVMAGEIQRGGNTEL